MTALVHKTITYIEDLFRGNTGGHDAAHSIRVYRNAMRIAETEPEADKEIVALAALLHDADDHKLFHTENNENTRSFLMENRTNRSPTRYPFRSSLVFTRFLIFLGFYFLISRKVSTFAHVLCWVIPA